MASPHQFPIALDHLFLSLILHPSHCRQEPPPSPPPPHQTKTSPTPYHIATRPGHRLACRSLCLSGRLPALRALLLIFEEKKRKKRGKNTLALGRYLDAQNRVAAGKSNTTPPPPPPPRQRQELQCRLPPLPARLFPPSAQRRPMLTSCRARPIQPTMPMPMPPHPLHR